MPDRVIEVKVKPDQRRRYLLWTKGQLAAAREDPAPRPRLPDSGRRVRVTALLIACSHIHTGELVLRGMEPREAFARSCDWYFWYLLLEAYRVVPGAPQERPGLGLNTRELEYVTTWAERATWPADDMNVDVADMPEWKPVGKRWTHTCFTRAAGQNAAVIAHGAAAEEFAVPVPPADADRLAWMLEMMRRYATGAGSLPECARGAMDAAAGRPRQRRAPADPEWLAAELGEALDSTWRVLAAVVPGLPVRRLMLDGG